MERHTASKRRATAIQRAISWFITAETIAAVCACLACFAGAPFGIRAFDVLSGSMEPAIHVGSLAYVQTRIDCNLIKPGDVIAFEIGDGNVVTHRVVANDTESKLITTKGDANDANDAAPVGYGAVVGKTLGSIPHLGAAVAGLSDNKVRILGVAAIVNAALLAMLHCTSRILNRS